MTPSMMIAYACILAAALLPYLWVVIAKQAGERYDNRDPRGWLARQQNPRAIHGNAAQLNAFEAFAPFAAGVLMAQFAKVDVATINLLALAFVGFRVLHGAFYLANLHAWRSLSWFGGFVCVMGLMGLAILQVG